MTPDDFVYVIAMNDQRHKIGISKRPEARLAQLQTGHPDPLRLIYLVKTNRSLTVEHAAHRLLAKHRLSGEWFGVDAPTAIEAVNRAATRYPPKPPAPPSKREAKWAAFMAETEAQKAAALAVRVSLQLGPTRRKPGSMLKKR